MNKLLILLCCLLPVVSQAQIITTIAGNGVNAYSGDGGLAIAASIGTPDYCVADSKNNLYITDVQYCVVRKITPDGIISTIAGTGHPGYNGDNIPATNAELNWPVGLTIDAKDNIYIAELSGNRIRKVNITTGLISTIAGNGTGGYGGDGGPATASLLYNPTSICFDKIGNLYTNDPGNRRIRKVDTFGIITTFVGTGVPIINGDGGPATAASVANPAGLCADLHGNIFYADIAKRIRKINASTGIISTIAGNDSGGTATTGDGGPATNAPINGISIAFDKTGNLYISGYHYNNVRVVDNAGIIHTAAGTGAAGFNGDGGPAISAQLKGIFGIAFDTCGNLLITDRGNNRIRKVAYNPACWPTDIQIIDAQTNSLIYPNPANHLLHIDNLQTNAGYRILSIVGAAIQQGQLHAGSNELNIRELPPGIYLLEVNEDGKRSVQKIVKE